jgi:hypothetical protein
MDGKLLEIKDSVVTDRGYNYPLPETTDEIIYNAELMVREISETGNPEENILASSWSEALPIKVFRATNIPPVAKAQAGILIESVIIFNDLVDYAKTGDLVTYTADDSYDPDGDDTLLEYEWRLIDSRGGSINLMGDKYAKTFERTYNEPGTYTAILTVTDERGGYSTWQVDVIVSDSGGGSLPQDGEDDTYSTTTLIGGAAVGIAVGVIFTILGKTTATTVTYDNINLPGTVPTPFISYCQYCSIGARFVIGPFEGLGIFVSH